MTTLLRFLERASQAFPLVAIVLVLCVGFAIFVAIDREVIMSRYRALGSARALGRSRARTPSITEEQFIEELRYAYPVTITWTAADYDGQNAENIHLFNAAVSAFKRQRARDEQALERAV